MEEKCVIKNYSMPRKISDLIDYWAAKTGRSRSGFVREAVVHYIPALVGEKIYDVPKKSKK